MKGSGFWVLYLMVVVVVGTTLIMRGTSTRLSISGADSSGNMARTTINRKLKEGNYNPSTGKESDAGAVNLEDYHPIDPVPSSKASIKPGPIEHGTPLNPYIPKPSPPSPGHPKTNGGLA